MCGDDVLYSCGICKYDQLRRNRKERGIALRGKKVLTIVLFALVFFCLIVASLPYFRSETKAAPDGSLEIHFIDVGQGDAALILCDGHAMLIDGGTPKNSNRLFTYLRKHQVDSLDYIIATHPHDDHVGGLAGALNAALAQNAFCCVTQAEGRAFASFLKYLDQQGIALTVPKPGERFALGSAVFTILGPLRENSEMNDNSLVIRLQYGDFSALFTGDAEASEENDLLSSGAELQSNLLKVGHHGSANASTEAFLDAVQPEISVISCGKENEYGHPAEQVLNRLRRVGSEILRTDQSGDIIVSVQPDGSYSFSGIVSNWSEDGLENVTYIINTNSNKFHDPHCPSAQDIRAENRLETTQSRETLIAQGYQPCGRCNP